MGQALSILFPPKSNFTTDDIPDLTGKVVIVTGANTGSLDPQSSIVQT